MGERFVSGLAGRTSHGAAGSARADGPETDAPDRPHSQIVAVDGDGDTDNLDVVRHG